MRLLLYNIRYGAGSGGRFHFPFPYSGYLKHTTKNLEQIVAFIKSVAPDIIGLVEVDSGSFRSRQSNQAAAIAKALGHFHVYQSKYGVASLASMLPLLNKQGNALLTSGEIKAQHCHYFRQGIKRLVMQLDLKDLTIFLVHLSVQYRHRHFQLSDLYTMIKGVTKPVIVAGDFNPLRDKSELELFLAASGLRSANVNGLPTYSSRSPRKQLDFVLHSPEIHVTRFEVPRVTLSDHLPVICEFDIHPKR